MIIKTLRLAGAALFLAATSLFAGPIPAPENLLPADTLAFFAMPDAAAARAAAKTSPGWMFWNDPAMKPFRDKFVDKVKEQFVAPLERDLGVKVADFADLPQGQFAVAVTVNGSNGSDAIPPGLLLLLDAKDKSESMKTNLTALVKKWTDAGRAVRTEQFHGLTFTVVPLSSNDFAGIFPKKNRPAGQDADEAKPAKSGEIYFTQFKSLLVLANSPKVAEPVAAHLTGGGAPSIADNPVFAADKLSQFRDNPQYYGWFNGKAFFELLNQAAAQNEDSPSALPNLSAGKILGALGLNGVKSASFALRETHAGVSLDAHVTAPEATREGILKVLAIAPKDASVPPFVPADAVKFSRFRLDGRQTWAELQKMVGNVLPNGQAIVGGFIAAANSIGQQKNPGFDLRNDLFGNLSDDVITYQKTVAGNSLAELANPPTIYLVAVNNPDAVINALRTLFAMSNPQEGASTPREFLGRKIYSIALKSGAPGANGVPQPRSLLVSFSSGYLAMSSDSAILEEFLRNADGKTKPLREDPGLVAAMQQAGGAGGGVFGYENQRETMRVTFKALKNTMAADTALKMFPPTFRDWLDFNLLPDYDGVAKYFYVSTFAGSANSEGLTLKVFTPRPPQLN